MSWVNSHIHAIVAVASAVGVTAAAIAANTTGLLPNSVGAWLTAVGSIIAVVVAHVTIPPVAEKMSVRFSSRAPK